MTKYFLNNKTDKPIDFAGLVVDNEPVEVTADIAANAVKTSVLSVTVKADEEIITDEEIVEVIEAKKKKSKKKKSKK